MKIQSLGAALAATLILCAASVPDMAVARGGGGMRGGGGGMRGGGGFHGGGGFSGGGGRSFSGGSFSGGAGRSSFGNAGARDVRSSASSNVNFNGNRNFNNANINNRNINVNNINGNNIRGACNGGCYGRGWDDYHPIAAGAAIGAAAAVTAAAIGSVAYSLPPDCAYVNSYYQCGSTWYEPQYEGTNVQYVVVNQPG